MARLKGKVALVTGGASGIGRGVVERFVAEGARVMIVDLNKDLMREVTEQLGEAADACQADVTDEAAIRGMVRRTVDRFGRLDIAVNGALAFPAAIREKLAQLRAAMAQAAPNERTAASADIGPAVPFWEMDSDTFKATIDGMLSAVFVCMKYEAAQMAAQGDGGAIINISSINARQPGEGGSAYSAAKAGVEALTRAAGMDLGPQKIRVTAIAPGLIRTPASEVGIFNDPKRLEAFRRNTPLDRHGMPADIAAAAAFLASDDGAWITAETLTIDGGQSTRAFPSSSDTRAIP